MKLLFALLLTITLGALVQAQAPRVVKVSASKILDDVFERKKNQPRITSKELAAYANELLVTRGSDYDFDVCEILSSRDKKSTAAFLPKRYRASLTNGQELGLKQGTWIENFPRDPQNSYLSFMKFEAGNKTYIIRFTAPCT